jgi:hypothetical protein
MLLRDTRAWRVAWVVLAVAAGTGCSEKGASDIGTPTSPSGGNPSPESVSSSDPAFCASETNRYRAMVGQPALTQSAELEAFGLAAARSDHASGDGHAYFRANAVATTGENMVLRWPFSGTRSLISSALAAFWSEGPGGGHYENMPDAGWRQMGCGIHIQGAQATLAQEFRR